MSCPKAGPQAGAGVLATVQGEEAGVGVLWDLHQSFNFLNVHRLCYIKSLEAVDSYTCK